MNTMELYEPLFEEVSKRTARLVIQHLEKRNTVQPGYFTVEQAGAYIGRSKDGMTALLKQGEIPVIRVGVRVHIAKKDLDTFMMNHRQ